MSSPITDPAALAAAIDTLVQTGAPQVFLYGVSGGDDNPVLAIFPEVVPSSLLMALFLGEGGDDVVSGTVWHDPDSQRLWFSGDGAEQSSLGEALATVFGEIHPALLAAGVCDPPAEEDPPPPLDPTEPASPPDTATHDTQPTPTTTPGLLSAPSAAESPAARLDRHLRDGSARFLYCPVGPDGSPYLELRDSGSPWNIAELWSLAQRCGDPQVAWGEVVNEPGRLVVYGEGPAYRSLRDDAEGELEIPALAEARFEGPRAVAPVSPAVPASPSSPATPGTPASPTVTAPANPPTTPPVVRLSRPEPPNPEVVNATIVADILAKMLAAAEQLRAGRYHRLADDVLAMLPTLANAAPAEAAAVVTGSPGLPPAELSRRMSRVLDGVKKIRLNGRSRSLAELAGEPFPELPLGEQLAAVPTRGPARLQDPQVAPIVEQLRGLLAAIAESASQLHSWWEQRSMMAAAQTAMVSANLDALVDLVRMIQRVLAIAAGVPAMVG